MHFLETIQQDANRPKPYEWNCFATIWCKMLIILLCLTTFIGCAERPYTAEIADVPKTQTATAAKTETKAAAKQDDLIRVLLLDNVQNCRLSVNCPFTISDERTQAELAHSGRLANPVNVTITTGGFLIGDKSIAADSITITPDYPFIFTLNGDDFRGKLTLVADVSRASFDAVNTVRLEPYLAGVVGAEMSDYWEPQALKAQAIAARTYCLYVKKHYGAGRSWDVSKTVASQVYRGIKAESAQVWQAVNETSGQILVSGTTEELFPAYYCSACGGHTENSQNIFGEYFQPLTGVPCPYCIDIAKTNRFFWPTVQFDKAAVSEKLLRKYQKLQPLGKIINISTSDQTNYGSFSRITMVRLIGSTGNSDSIRAEDLRLTIDPSGTKIKSMICKIANMGVNWAFASGRGYGHGVGLCQCGAQGMARQGKMAYEILSYYYPGSKIVGVD